VDVLGDDVSFRQVSFVFANHESSQQNRINSDITQINASGNELKRCFGNLLAKVIFGMSASS
jgi:hypothetical protein